MDKSKFAICVKDCRIYFELDPNDQQSLSQGALLQVCDEDNCGVTTVNLFHINYITKTISVIDKRYLCEQKFLQSVPLKLFRFLVSEEVVAERFQLLIKSDILCNLRKRNEILLEKSFLKYFHNIICQILYIGEVPELGVGDFIGIKLMNCVLPLMMVGIQKNFASKYIGDFNDSLLIPARDLIKFFIKEIRQPSAIVPSQSQIYSCIKCKTVDQIIHFRECTHKLCKDCLIAKFLDRQTLEISCDYRMSQVETCSKTINLEHFMFLYKDLQEIFNEIVDKNRNSCFKCSTTDNVVQISDCEHFLCKSCALDSLKDESILMEYCQFLLNNGEECKMPLIEKYLKKFMSRDDLAAYEDRKLAYILKTTPESRQCKTPNCKSYFILKDKSYTQYQCKICKNYNCIKCDDVHTVSCSEHQRTILDGADEVKKIELLAKLDDDEIMDHDLVRNGTVESYAEAAKFRVLRANYQNYKENDLLWAIRQSNDMVVIERSLNNECNFCNEFFSHNNIFGMITCQHTFCINCAKTYFTVQITDKTIRDCICPTCKLPNLDDNIDESEYFGLMGALLKNILNQNTYELFDRKTRDRALHRLSNFVWCVKCAYGFEVNPNRVNAACTECNTIFCITCNEIWQEQHAGISCPQFKEWKDANDPKNQSEGVANYLDKNGIECPSPDCKAKYSLARGGCLHFTCIQCSYQFCFGCRKPMLAGAKCDKFHDCPSKGLHAHHPRNCLTILRDCQIASLESLLTKANINFTGIPQNGAVCQIPIQRETPSKMIDCLCDKTTVNEKIGLCELHYKEGLIDLIFKSKIDPVDILDLGEVKAELIRNHVAEPRRLVTDTDDTYREKCIIVIKNNLPLV